MLLPSNAGQIDCGQPSAGIFLARFRGLGAGFAIVRRSRGGGGEESFRLFFPSLLIEDICQVALGDGEVRDRGQNSAKGFLGPGILAPSSVELPEIDTDPDAGAARRIEDCL